MELNRLSLVRERRKQLGFTLEQVADMLGISKQAVGALELAEVSGAISVQRLRDVADVLGCDLTIQLTPKSLDHEVRNAWYVSEAKRIFDSVHETMALENQPLTAKDRESFIEEMSAQLRADDHRRSPHRKP